MDRLPAHHLEGANESVTDVGAAAVTNAISPTSLADTPVAPFGCRTIRLSHHQSVWSPDPSSIVFLLMRQLPHRLSLASSHVISFAE